MTARCMLEDKTQPLQQLDRAFVVRARDRQNTRKPEFLTRDLVVGPRTGLEEPLDGIAELWVESIEALDRDWSTDKAKEIVQAFFEDEKNFIDWSRSTILVSKEIIVMPWTGDA